MTTVLFDPHGQHQSADALRRALSPFTPAEEFAAYAVRNMGYARVTTTPAGVRIWVRPKIVGQKTLASVLDELCRIAPPRVALSWFDRGWQNEIIAHVHAAIARLNKLIDDAQTRPEDRLRKSTIGLERLTEGHLFHTLVGEWSALGGAWAEQQLRPLLETSAGGRYTLAEFDEEADRIELKQYGPGYDTTATSWITRSHGERVEDQADDAFGRWVAETYRQAARNRVPVVDAVDATLIWPGHASRRYHYTRLILPFQKNEHQLVLSVSVPGYDSIKGPVILDKCG